MLGSAIAVVCSAAAVADAQSGREVRRTLCAPRETPILSFRTETAAKIVSVCEGVGSNYLVYRFGRASRIDLQYSAMATAKSWQLFEFSGYSRSGGPQNDGVGDYSLRFVNHGVVYTVFQNWRVDNDDYQLGILIEGKGKSVVLRGDAATQVGSLVSLEVNKNIKNVW